MSSLQFAPFKSFVDASFFRELSNKKLNEFQLSEAEIPICAQYSIPIVFDRQPALSVSALSFSIDEARHVSSDSVPINYLAPGWIINVNTLDSFKELDKSRLVRDDGKTLITSILDRSILDDPSQLVSFHIAAFSDIKKYKFYYWFAFPAIPLQFDLQAVREVVDHEGLVNAIEHYRRATSDSNQWGFFALQESDDHQWTATTIKSYVAADRPLEYGLRFAFIDSSTLPNVPSWPLRNFLALLASLDLPARTVSILCYRDQSHLTSVPTKSFWLDILLPDQASIEPSLFTKTIGWERNSAGKLAPKVSDLGTLINPIQLADQAVDLNLKLMKWRIAPSLDLDAIKNQKCLLLGAGTLGSYIARGLLGWGVRKITLVDSGKVSFSNPVRQPLYKFEDCLNGGVGKAKRAAEALKEIYPSVDSDGYELEIPMAGHPITNENRQKADYDKVVQLIEEHDVIFLLMDSRESRWLPTTICSALSKQVINVALGFDTYVVMRHGISTAKGTEHNPHLGCYFCNDIVAPIDSVSGQTLDQMCTVTRPGIAMAASSSAVELLASIQQHPEKGLAPAFKNDEEKQDEEDFTSALSVLPHQLRGFLHRFDTMKIWGPSYPNCSACSSPIVNAWRAGGWDFVKEALDNPQIVSEISGLAEILRKADELDLGGSDSDWGSTQEESPAII